MGVTVINPFVFAAAAPTSIASYRSDWIVSNFSSPTSLSITQANLTSGGGAPVSGDIVLVVVSTTFDPKIGSPMNAPAGFTLLQSDVNFGGGHSLAVYRRTATASEGTYSVTAPTGVLGAAMGAVVVKDVVSFDASAIRTGTTTFIVSPSNLVTTANSDFIAHFVMLADSTTDITIQSPLTDVGSAGQSGFFWLHMAWETGGFAGTQVSRTVATGGGQNWYVVSVAIK